MTRQPRRKLPRSVRPRIMMMPMDIHLVPQGRVGNNVVPRKTAKEMVVEVERGTRSSLKTIALVEMAHLTSL